MGLEITRRADLAVQAMTALATDGTRMKGGELAETLETTVCFVAQVVAPLVKAGWVRSDPGPTGGYTACVALDRVSVLDVIESVDGPTDAGRCVVENRACGDGPTCVLHVAWGKARGELVATLREASLANLATRTQR